MASAWEAPGKQTEELALTTAAEIYQGALVPHLSVLQLRSAVIEGRRRAFTEDLWAWACAAGVAEVVVVSSCSSHVKVDADLAAGTDLRYVCFGAEVAPWGLGPDMLPLSHSLAEAEVKPGQSRDVAAVLRFLRGGGLARPLLLQAARAAEEAAPGTPGKDLGTPSKDAHDPAFPFSPPPRTTDCPSIICLLGLTSEGLDFQLTEQLSRAACAGLAHRLRVEPVPPLKPPPSWLFELEVAAPERRLWA